MNARRLPRVARSVSKDTLSQAAARLAAGGHVPVRPAGTPERLGGTAQHRHKVGPHAQLLGAADPQRQSSATASPTATSDPTGSTSATHPNTAPGDSDAHSNPSATRSSSSNSNPPPDQPTRDRTTGPTRRPEHRCSNRLPTCGFTDQPQ